VRGVRDEGLRAAGRGAGALAASMLRCAAAGF
jgi:hypothetical protein